jgi:hypothetical protein
LIAAAEIVGTCANARRGRLSTAVLNCWRDAALGGAATFREYRTFEPDFLNGFDPGTVLLLSAQEALPAMRQAQPKLAVIFVAGLRGQLPALLGLILEEIAGFDHCITTTKAPLAGAWTKQKRGKPVFVPLIQMGVDPQRALYTE